MKKLFAAFSFLLFTSTTFALSCMPPEPLPPLKQATSQYETIGVLEIIDFQSEDFIDQTNNEFPNMTAEGKPQKYTIHSAKWKSLKKGTKTSEIFSLRINATSWMGYPNKFEPGTLLPLTTKAILADGLLTVDQDFGCYFDEWAMYSVEDIESLNEIEQTTEKNPTPEIPGKNTSLWGKIMSWFSKVFKN